MSGFDWNSQTSEAVFLLAQGYTIKETAKKVKVAERTIYRWKEETEFMAEIDRLSLMIGVASRAERLRIAMQVIREKLDQESHKYRTEKDLLDWVKFAQSETDGVKLDLTALVEAMKDDPKD